MILLLINLRLQTMVGVAVVGETTVMPSRSQSRLNMEKILEKAWINTGENGAIIQLVYLELGVWFPLITSVKFMFNCVICCAGLTDLLPGPGTSQDLGSFG